jgi:nucleoid-associated protein YgaU
MKRVFVVAGSAVAIVVAVAVVAIMFEEDAMRVVRAPTSSTPPAGAPATPPAPATIEAPGRPSFDIVRVSPTGSAVIAGRSAPNADITITDQSGEIGRTRANQRGEWVLVPEKPLTPGTRELGIVAKAADGKTAESESRVVVVVPERAGEGALAVAMPRDGRGAQVLQSPGGLEKPLPPNQASIDIVEYSDKGDVVISGRAAPGTRIQAYVDNQPAGTTRTNERGTYSVTLDSSVSLGSHQVRIDAQGADGKVAARAETKFVRTEIADAQMGSRRVLVQSGNSLWRIAQRSYGAGLRYTLIFDANREQIRDADLIYPGQIFVVPPQASGGDRPPG